jgi:hypothetical protein
MNNKECWQKCELAKPYCKLIWRLLKKLEMVLPFYLATQFLDA